MDDVHADRNLTHYYMQMVYQTDKIDLYSQNCENNKIVLFQIMNGICMNWGFFPLKISNITLFLNAHL